MAAGGNVSIQVTGAGWDSTLTVQGSNLEGGGGVSLKADGDTTCWRRATRAPRAGRARART
ncbi:hemagglutinin repeat-containing protein [Ralstonia solanacearum]|uniref:hemagglutinin repeat-containing protein n=1 Tax=Ralstonia solanacearum TaxID=305 RepID=UPI0012D473E3|nr:hemagglutinin repeat-containing protein [Ralstonia solanacearum]MBB6588996.1 hemagglutinin repeat-containing protein [Ralstonia solanacearum]MCG3577119.1 hemagglutinin repeat-containing protein [Ralstonia solanacearum]MCL9826171.1 hemagglutinin repeat-containing protein [Ralstonia solanacearum]MCL9829066.1 hemagglutinin repeat-containing protein [Ralstonia solanacearum]MCL9833847.1 hemagglutinin repeat-containing protein [Ralstonia solanacearum]